MTFWEKFVLLFGTLWCFIGAFMFYMWKLQQKQQTVLRYIAYRLTALERALSPKDTPPKKQEPVQEVTPPKKEQTPEPIITINKNEPISKYETVKLPDEININFVDR